MWRFGSVVRRWRWQLFFVWLALTSVPLPAFAKTSLSWPDAKGWRELPLLNPRFNFASSKEALRLYAYSPTLALAVGRGIVLKGKPGLTRTQLAAAFPGLREVAALAEIADQRIFFARVNQAEALQPALQRLRQHSLIEWAEPDVLQVPQGNVPAEMVVPHYDLAGWSVSRDLEFDAAHRISTGKDVRIAVIDAGFDFANPALRSVDVLARYDTASRSTDVSPRTRGDVHGSLVAGILFARDPKGVVRGIAPDASMIAIRLATTWTSDIVLALQVAVLARADVVNCSWDIALTPRPVIDVLEHLVRDGREGRGTLVVVAAGNTRSDHSSRASLANRNEVISVTALDHANVPIAAYGQGVDIAAPSMLPSISIGAEGASAYLGKTSAAAPLVSGSLALMLAIRPELTADAARSALLESASTIRGGRSGESQPGFGKLAPLRALARIAPTQKELQ